MSNTMDDVERLGTPPWLQQLVDGHAAGRIPPGGMVWEEPPDARATVRNDNVHGGRTRKYLHARQGWAHEHYRGMPSDLLPVATRELVAQRLRAHPDRWARVFDGDKSGARVVWGWFRNRFPAPYREVVVRGHGLTTAVYVRVVSVDMFAVPAGVSDFEGDDLFA